MQKSRAVRGGEGGPHAEGGEVLAPAASTFSGFSSKTPLFTNLPTASRRQQLGEVLLLSPSPFPSFRLSILHSLLPTTCPQSKH